MIKLEWYQLAVRVGYKAARPYMREHLTKVGRRWLIEGIYRELAESDDPSDVEFAIAVFVMPKITTISFLALLLLRFSV